MKTRNFKLLYFCVRAERWRILSDEPHVQRRLPLDGEARGAAETRRVGALPSSGTGIRAIDPMSSGEVGPAGSRQRLSGARALGECFFRSTMSNIEVRRPSPQYGNLKRTFQASDPDGAVSGRPPAPDPAPLIPARKGRGEVGLR